MTTAAELEGAGLYDPASPHAERRLAAMRLLLDHGATIDDLVANRDDLGYLAGRLANGGLPTMTYAELAHRTGLPIELVRRLTLAAGLPDPGPDEPAATAGDSVLFETFAAAVAVFGEDMAFQLARVLGASVARVADALVSAFITTVGTQVTAEDPSGLALVQANFDLVALRPGLMATMEQLLLRHLVNAGRPQSLTATTGGYESQRLVVGFVDLVGSTRFSSQLTVPELGAAMSQFESTSADIVVHHRGRVVKLIGDEIMFTTPDPVAGCAIARDLVQAFAHHPVLPPVRAGLAYGEVLTRDGDCFGPVVNLAARVVALAGASEVLLDEATADAAGAEVDALGPMSLKGFDAPVPVLRLTVAST